MCYLAGRPFVHVSDDLEPAVDSSWYRESVLMPKALFTIPLGRAAKTHGEGGQ